MKLQGYLIIFYLFFGSFIIQANDLKCYDLEQEDPISQKRRVWQEIKEIYDNNQPVKLFLNPYDSEMFLKKNGKHKYYTFECPFCKFKRTFKHNTCVFVGEDLDHFVNAHQGDIVKKIEIDYYGGCAYVLEFNPPTK